MKKKLLLMLICLLIPTNIRAEEIDINKAGNIDITYKYGNLSITDNKITLYKVAEYNQNKELTYTKDYKLDDNLAITTASEWNDLAIKLNNYSKNNNINSINNCITNSDGKCDFKNLEIGLYLISSDKKNIDNYEYTSSPTLIAIPTNKETDNTLIYDIDVTLKVEAKQINNNNPNNNQNNNNANNNFVDDKIKNNTIVPKTIDIIYNYIALFTFSLIAIVLVVLYINKERRKKKNEKSN